MNKPAINIQDGYLFQILKSGQSITIELVNQVREPLALRMGNRYFVFDLVVLYVRRKRMLQFKWYACCFQFMGKALFIC